jgi:hypothetical protein
MEKLKITIPESWDEIKLGQYIEFELLEKDNLTNIELMFKIISIFCDIDEEELNKLTIAQINNIGEQLEWVNKKPNNNFYQSFEIDGIKYGFHPNLHEIKVGEWVDLENLLKTPIKNLHKILSVLYRPITKIKRGENRYNIEDYNSVTANERSELFLYHMNMEQAFGASLFFLNFVEKLLVNITDSLMVEMEKLIMEETTTKD